MRRIKTRLGDLMAFKDKSKEKATSFPEKKAEKEGFVDIEYYYDDLNKRNIDEDLVEGKPIEKWPEEDDEVNDKIETFDEADDEDEYPTARKSSFKKMPVKEAKSRDIYEDDDYEIDDALKEKSEEYAPAKKPKFESADAKKDYTSKSVMSKPVKKEAKKTFDDVQRFRKEIKKQKTRDDEEENYKKFSFVRKKEVHKKEQKEPRKHSRKSIAPWIVILIIAVIVGVILLVVGLKKLSLQDNSEIAARVNGEPITVKEINEQYAKIPDYYKSIITKEFLLNKTIEEKLLMQEAGRKGIRVGNEEVDSTIELAINQSPYSREQIDAQLKAQNTTWEEIKDSYKKQLTIGKLLNQTILGQITVSDEEVEQFYNNFSDQFIVPEQLRASHILVCFQGSAKCLTNLTESDAKIKITSIYNKLKRGENFTELAVEFSDDLTAKSNSGDLGYFAKGEMVKPFEDAAFATPVGELSNITKTVFGYHVILVTGRKEAGKKQFSEVYGEIKNALLQQKQQSAFRIYVEQLRSKAIIEIYQTSLYNTTIDAVPKKISEDKVITTAGNATAENTTASSRPTNMSVDVTVE